jgi:hypothetical protein
MARSEATKQFSNRRILALDCFAEPVIGRISRDPLAGNDGLSDVAAHSESALYFAWRK